MNLIKNVLDPIDGGQWRYSGCRDGEAQPGTLYTYNKSLNQLGYGMGGGTKFDPELYCPRLPKEHRTLHHAAVLFTLLAHYRGSEFTLIEISKLDI